MLRWLWWTGGGLLLAITCGILLVGVASWRWRRMTGGLIGQLTRPVETDVAGVISRSSVDSFALLPPPVQRYFLAVLRDGQPMVRMARLTQTGTFRMLGSDTHGGSDFGWSRFRAREVFVTEPPGFVWDARIRTAPFLSVHVRDRYLHGQGSMLGAVLGLVNVVDEHDKPELDAGALHRYLAETVWFPTALLPGQGVTWTPVDDSHAVATLSNGGRMVSLEFSFASTGEITGAFTPNRYREEGGRYVLAPWGAICRHYEECGGMRIPMECEAYWKVGDKILPYWRGQITHADYDFAP